MNCVCYWDVQRIPPSVLFLALHQVMQVFYVTSSAGHFSTQLVAKPLLVLLLVCACFPMSLYLGWFTYGIDASSENLQENEQSCW